MSRSRVPTTCCQGTSGASTRVSVEILRAASPTISSKRTTASASISSESRSSLERPRTNSIALRAASSMWRSATVSRSFGRSRRIHVLGFRQHRVPKITTQAAGRMQVHTPPQHPGQLFLQRHEAEPRNVLWLELHKDVDVARRCEVVPQHRPKQRQPRDVVPAAQVAQRLMVDAYTLRRER